MIINKDDVSTQLASLRWSQENDQTFFHHSGYVQLFRYGTAESVWTIKRCHGHPEARTTGRVKSCFKNLHTGNQTKKKGTKEQNKEQQNNNNNNN